MLLYAFQDENGHWHGDRDADTLDGTPGTGVLRYRPAPGAAGCFAGQRLNVLYGPSELEPSGAEFQLEDGVRLTATWHVLELLEGGPEESAQPPRAPAPEAAAQHHRAQALRTQISHAGRHYALSLDPGAGGESEVWVRVCTPDGEILAELVGTAEPQDLDPIARLFTAALCTTPAPPPPPAVPRPRTVAGTWTQEELQLCRDRFRAGASPEDIAACLGRSLKAVRFRLGLLGLTKFPTDLLPRTGATTAPANLPQAEQKGTENSHLEELRRIHPNAYARWTPQEDELLAQRAAEGATVAELATEFGRQSSAIEQRLLKTGAKGPAVTALMQLPAWEED